METVVQTCCSVYADILTHCNLGLNKLSSSFLNSAGLKKEINTQGGNCIPSSSTCILFRLLFFSLYFGSSLICKLFKQQLFSNKMQTPILEKCPLFIVLLVVIQILL